MEILIICSIVRTNNEQKAVLQIRKTIVIELADALKYYERLSKFIKIKDKGYAREVLAKLKKRWGR